MLVALKLTLVLVHLGYTSADSTASWLARRSALRFSIWGSPELPSDRAPDIVEHVVNATGGAPASAGVQRVVWNISRGFFPLTSTTYYVPRTKGERTESLMIHHHGHTQGCDNLDGNGTELGCPKFWDFYNVTDFIHGLQLDAIFMYMPLLGPNQQNGFPTDHNWFAQWEGEGDRPISYFITPVSLTVNYALSLGYKHVYMMGKSGGGWTTTVAAAADPRISLSFPIAGSVPLAIKVGPYYLHDKGDFEQLPQLGPMPAQGPWYLDACNYTCQYVLAGLEAGRTSLQILHENDPCCFRTASPRSNPHATLSARAVDQA
jgi:hypothetical protein